MPSSWPDVCRPIGLGRQGQIGGPRPSRCCGQCWCSRARSWRLSGDCRSHRPDGKGPTILTHSHSTFWSDPFLHGSLELLQKRPHRTKDFFLRKSFKLAPLFGWKEGGKIGSSDIYDTLSMLYCLISKTVLDSYSGSLKREQGKICRSGDTWYCVSSEVRLPEKI